MPPHLSGRIVYHPPLPRMRNQLVDRAPMGTTVKVCGCWVGSSMAAALRACSSMFGLAAGMAACHACFQAGMRRRSCRRGHLTLVAAARQVLAFYERPLWRPSANLSQCITFALDPHASTSRGHRSVDSVYDVSPPGGPGVLASFLW